MTARATVLVTPLEGNPFSPEGRGDDLLNLETEARVLKSDAIGDAVANRLGGATASQMLSGLSVTVPPNTQILTLDYTASTKATAKARAQAFGDLYLQSRQDRAAAVNATALRRVQNQIAAETRTVERLQRRLATEASSNERRLLQAEITGSTNQIGDLRVQLSELQAGLTGPGQVISPATVVSRGANTTLVLFGGGGALVGFLLGIALVVVRSRSESRIHEAADVEVSGLPLLSTVELGELYAVRPLVTSPWGSSVPLGPGLRDLRLGLMATGQPRPFCVLVAGASSATTDVSSALGLAYALARSEVTTTLVDARGSGVLGTDESTSPGLSDVLTGGVDLQKAVRSYGKHLSVLPMGSPGHDMDDLLVSDRFAQVIGRLQGSTNVVVVATNDVTATDGRTVALVADCVVVEAARGRTSTGDLTAIGDDPRLARKVAGVVYLTPEARHARKKRLKGSSSPAEPHARTSSDEHSRFPEAPSSENVSDDADVPREASAGR